MLHATNFGPVFLDNCINSKFLILEIVNDTIIGACFVGGMFNSNGIEIEKNARGKKLGSKLLEKLLEECKKQKISFLTGVFKPSNQISIHTHMKIGYLPLFAIFYNVDEGYEIPVILPFNKKGKILASFLRVFNTKIGNLFFVFSFKIFTPLLKNLIAFDPKNMPKLDLVLAIKNFKKVESLI